MQDVCDCIRDYNNSVSEKECPILISRFKTFSANSVTTLGTELDKWCKEHQVETLDWVIFEPKNTLHNWVAVLEYLGEVDTTKENKQCQ